MDSIKFVKAINQQVRNAATEDVVKLLEHPPGRRPKAELTDLSNWFKSLATKDQLRIIQIIEMASNQSVFGFLCVLDGVRAIEDPEQSGVLELWHIKNNNKILLNNPSDIPLHDL